MTAFFETVFDAPTRPLGIIVLDGAEELGEKIDKYLVSWYNKDIAFKNNEPPKKSFLIKNECPRFTTGDAKGIIYETTRGRDLYILVDVGNYSCTYPLFGSDNKMSPDDHYANLKRIISASGGKSSRITVIMPLLYGGRQHRRNARESLDCAQMLKELFNMGVSDIITFDAHDPRVQNAEPLMGFDNFFPTYQIMKQLVNNFPDIKLDKNHFMVVSPDEGAMNRNIYYASIIGVDLGMFYKRRDYATIVNGRNPIVAHEYIGSSVMGMDIFVNDDIIATGESVLKLCKELKEKGAGRIFLSATYALFTEGLERFNTAYEEGLFDAVLSTNLTYRCEELKNIKWFFEADLSKYIAYIISACNQNHSMSSLLEPHDKINELLEGRK